MQCRSRSFFNLKPVSVIVYQFQTVKFIQMMSLTFGLFTQVSGSGPLGPLVFFIYLFFYVFFFRFYTIQRIEKKI